jgi:hypothetical protein
MKQKALTHGVVPGRPLIAVAISRAGLRDGSKCMGFAACWMIAARKHGPSMTCDQYADFWLQSRSQAFREQGLWREVFPEFPTPSAMWAVCARGEVRSDDQGEVVAMVCSLPYKVAA